MRARTGKVDFVPISYPESSGSLASAWLPGDQPLVKEPEDSGYESDFVPSSSLKLRSFWSAPRKCGLCWPKTRASSGDEIGFVHIVRNKIKEKFIMKICNQTRDLSRISKTGIP